MGGPFLYYLSDTVTYGTSCKKTALGCTTESHPLYGTFMATPSSCIFELNENDYALLCSVKKGELIAVGVPCPSVGAVKKD